MNQPPEVNGPDEENSEEGLSRPSHVHPSEAPTVTVPKPDPPTEPEDPAEAASQSDPAETSPDAESPEADPAETPDPTETPAAVESPAAPEGTDPPSADSTPHDGGDTAPEAQPGEPESDPASAEGAPQPVGDGGEEVDAASRTEPEDDGGQAAGDPAESASDGPGEAAEGGWGGRELVESVYGPLSEFYERIDARLREAPGDDPPVGWAPHIAALRALREERVAGDWEVLARFLVAPGSLEKPEGLRLIAEGGDDVVRGLVKEIAAADGRALLVAPTPERAAELLRGLEADPEVFSLLIETRPATAEADSVQTQALPPVDDEALRAARDQGSTETVEFKPVTGPVAGADESSSAVTRVEALPVLPEGDPAGPEEGEGSSAVTRVEALPVLPEEEPAAPQDGPSAPDAGPSVPEAAPSAADAASSAPEAGPSTPETQSPAPEAGPSAPEAGPSAPEARVRSAALRPVGEAWRQAWETEVRLLRRGLMWLEQWPRDAAALRSVEAENLRRAEELEAERAAMARAIEAFRGTAAAAERAAEEADAEAERFAALQREAEEELAGPRAEAERLKTAADEAAAEANALTRAADASYARCVQIDERTKTAQAELEAARRTEASLTEELARAREALPGAAEEAHRLAAVDADTAAEGHAAYYRLAAAESALAAARRKMTLAQRLHVASPPAELKDLRAEVKARTREADEAAERARAAKEAAENAERIRRGLASFVSEGGARLAAAQEAQERLTTELAWLATERETAGAEHQEQARLASESVERATQAGMRARAAQQAAQVIEDRVNAARASREQSLIAATRARSDAENAKARAAETQAALERRAAEAAEETSAREARLEEARRVEAQSRERVRETCGSDPAENPDAVPGHQRRAMARIEELTAYLSGERSAGGEVLLRTADLVVGTPVAVGVSARDEVFDALIVADAGALTDGEFLIGAVRARGWILVGTPDSRPPSYREYAGAPSGGLDVGPFGRAAAAAPRLLEAPGA